MAKRRILRATAPAIRSRSEVGNALTNCRGGRRELFLKHHHMILRSGVPVVTERIARRSSVPPSLACYRPVVAPGRKVGGVRARGHFDENQTHLEAGSKALLKKNRLYCKDLKELLWAIQSQQPRTIRQLSVKMSVRALTELGKVVNELAQILLEAPIKPAIFLAK
jgi:hypothetical protein